MSLFQPLPALLVSPSPTASTSNRVQMPHAGAMPLQLGDFDQESEQHSFACEVCSKSFKRETNLMFHMATHRDRVVDETGVGIDQRWDAPTQCPSCTRVFGTKYQLQKHFLRRHFVGEKKYTCEICKTKSFTVKEDWSMHIKSCGRIFTCSCGVHFRSQATLKRHCKYNAHQPASLEGTSWDQALDELVGCGLDAFNDADHSSLLSASESANESQTTSSRSRDYGTTGRDRDYGTCRDYGTGTFDSRTHSTTTDATVTTANSAPWLALDTTGYAKQPAKIAAAVDIPPFVMPPLPPAPMFGHMPPGSLMHPQPIAMAHPAFDLGEMPAYTSPAPPFVVQGEAAEELLMQDLFALFSGFA